MLLKRVPKKGAPQHKEAPSCTLTCARSLLTSPDLESEATGCWSSTSSNTVYYILSLSIYIPLKPPPLGRFWRNFGASWGRNVALGSVLGANLRPVGVKIWLLGHLRGEDSPRGRQGTSKGQGTQNSPCACGPFWPENKNSGLDSGLPFWDHFLLNFGSHV